MAQHADHYKKYQVYFFLYLAVICELLIIIVERDEAEENLLFQQRELERRNRQIILELLKNMPAVSAAGDNQLKVNETRSFTISVKGLGEEDEVTKPPTIQVIKDGEIVETLSYPEDIRDSSIESVTGLKFYRFDWIADQGPGNFEFMVEAGTDRVSFVPDPQQETQIKVGSLKFERDDIQTAINSDPLLAGTPVEAFIRRTEDLQDKFFLEVVAEEFEQFVIKPGRRTVITARGYPVFNRLNVEGTSPDKVASINVVDGRGTVLSSGNTTNNPFGDSDPAVGAWVWTNEYKEAGEYQVRVDGSDRRDAGPLSRAHAVGFKVVVKEPYMQRSKPSGAFAGEMFNMSINVSGLEDAGDYAYSIEIDGNEMEKGVGNTIKYQVPDDALGKSLLVKATYRDRPYQLYADSASTELTSSEFVFPIGAPIDRIVQESFAESGEYPINQTFQFIAARCGICRSVNIKNISRGDIRIIAETYDGQDILDDYEVVERKNPSTGTDAGSLVKFYLRGKVNRDGTDATITIKVGSYQKEYNVILYPD